MRQIPYFDRADLARELKGRRVKSGITQKTLASHLGVSAQQYHKYESGRDRMAMEDYLSALLFLRGGSLKEKDVRDALAQDCYRLPVHHLDTLSQMMRGLLDDY